MGFKKRVKMEKLSFSFSTPSIYPITTVHWSLLDNSFHLNIVFCRIFCPVKYVILNTVTFFRGWIYNSLQQKKNLWWTLTIWRRCLVRWCKIAHQKIITVKTSAYRAFFMLLSISSFEVRGGYLTQRASCQKDKRTHLR